MGVRERNSVRVGGTGKDTMFFCHGFGCDQHMWRLLEPLYAKRYRTVVFDLVGSGTSDLTAYDPAKYSRTCVADPDRLAQLVGNLVSNAMAYGTSDHPVTVVSTLEAGAFSISVHNHGAPIPADVQSTLFQPMTRGSSGGAAGRSVGLGLYIVNEIARAHGGRATVRSLADEGTTFSIVCPSSEA